MTTHAPGALDEQLEDLASTQQQALGQRDAVLAAAPDVLDRLANLRIAAEELAAAHDAAMLALDHLPAFDAQLPELVGPYADLDLSPTARKLLSAFNARRLCDLQAGVDSAEGAIRRYTARVTTAYETHHGTGWRGIGSVLAIAPPPASGDVECCASGSCEVCRPGAHRG